MEPNIQLYKENFIAAFKSFTSGLARSVSCTDGQWTIKGFIDIYKNIFTISSDSKIISKILEIHLFPTILEFADSIGYNIVLAEKQNYYPDLTFINRQDDRIMFAVDIKTTFRRSNGKMGFTLGSHGAYFQDRECGKNIQFPYNRYKGHFCLGVVYSKASEGDAPDENSDLSETEVIQVKELGEPMILDTTNRPVNSKDNLQSITSVIKDLDFFFSEKWKIASDSQGSGNTANIGSVDDLEDLKNETGVFSQLGEDYFDEYWLNYNRTMFLEDDRVSYINTIWDFLDFKHETNKYELVGHGAKRRRHNR